MAGCHQILIDELGFTPEQATQKLREYKARRKLNSMLKRGDSSKTLDDLIAEDVAEVRKAGLRHSQAARIIRRLGLDQAKTQVEKETIMRRFLRTTDLQMKSQVTGDLNDVLREIERGDAWSVFVDPNMELDLARGMMDPDTITNPKIRIIVDAFKAKWANQVSNMNALGADIKDLRGYITRQIHNPTKLMSATGNILGDIKLRTSLVAQNGWQQGNILYKEAAYARWKNTIFPMLDRSRTFKDIPVGEEDRILKEAYATLTGETHFRANDNPHEFEEFIGKRSLASQVSAHRALHFLPDKWLEYNQQYGAGDIASALRQTTEHNAKNLALMRNAGANPEALFNHMQRNILQLPEQHINKYVWDEITGISSIPVNALTAKIGSSLRAITSLARLGGVVINSLPDLNNRMVIMKSNGVGFLDGYHDYFKMALQRLGSDAERKDLALAVGSMGKLHMGNMTTRFWSSDDPIELLSRAQEKFFKWNLMRPFDQLNQESVGMGLSKHLASLRNRTFEELSEELKGTFSTYGIGREEWELLKGKSLKPHGNELYFTPDAVDNISNAEALAYAKATNLRYGAVTDDIKANLVRDDLKARLQTYFHDQSQMVSLSPDAFDRAFFHRGTKAGTVTGELMRFIGQFKYFNLAFTRKIVKQAFVGPGGGFVTGAQFIVSSFLWGYAAFAAKQFLQHGEIPDPIGADPEQLANIIKESGLTGGGFGMYSSWLANWDKDLRQDLTSVIPALGIPADVANIPISGIKELMGNDRASASKAAVHFLKNDLPFVNTFYAKYILDHLILNDMLNRVDPGYIDRMSDRLQDEYNAKQLY